MKTFATGMDVSLLQHLEDQGVQFYEDGHPRDPLQIFIDHSVDFVRLRLFVDPSGRDGQVNDLQYTINLARRVKAAGLNLLLDLHYSDGWADPQTQTTPSAWSDQSPAALTDTLFSYTADVIVRFDAEGCLPDLLQTGNEITYGMLWPSGDLRADRNWDVVSGFLDAAVRGARSGGYRGRIMMHADQGGSQTICQWFFDRLQEQNVSFDVIGLSYYPFWHGTVSDLRANLAFLADRYGKEIILVETGHDWRGDTKAEYPASPQGQRDFLEAVFAAVRGTPNGLGAGVFYWAPEWIAGRQWHGPSWSDVWESRALFDADGNALPALHAFDSIKGRGYDLSGVLVE